MAPVDPETLLAQARRAYERGRLRRAALEGLAVTPLVAGLVLVCPQPALAVVAGALLYPVVVGLRWRGQAWGRAVWSGLLAGSIPIVVSLLTLACAGVCPLRAYGAVCLGACVAGGLAAGIVVGLRAARQGSGSGAFLAAAGLLVALVGVPACGFAGVAGGFGLLIGATAGAAPFVLRPLRTPGA
jgi:hypothetical protein